MTEVLRNTIRGGEQSLYGISKATGIDKSALGRFAAGKQSLRLDIADRLAEHFGLALIQQGTVKQ